MAASPRKGLLIELYGIEIKKKGIFTLIWTSFNRTIWNWNCSASYGCRDTLSLLIELYGIEMRMGLVYHLILDLLIELYGIEIDPFKAKEFKINYF